MPLSKLPSEAGIVIALSSLRARALFLLIWLALLGYGMHHLVREFRGYALAMLFQDAEGLEEALRFIPKAPEVHEQLGMIHLLDPTHFDPSKAVAYFQRAVALSPQDARYWMGLGRAYEAKGAWARAAQAYERAVTLAPYHFRPRWLYANFLLRAGRTDAALEHLHALVAMTPDVVENVCDLIWHVREGDVAVLQRLAEGRPAWVVVKIGEYLLAKGRAEEAIALWWALPHWDAATREGGRRLVRGLVRARKWREAERVWHQWLRREYGREPATTLWNGDFEHPIVEGGLDWRIASSREVAAGIDESTGYGDSRSLLLEFRARENVRYTGVAREIVVEPATRYVLQFAYKTQGMLSSNGLYVEVTDAEDARRMRVRSEPLPASEEWVLMRLEFVTTAETRAVRMVLGREPVHPLHDYIRGRAWFDAFALTRVSDDPSA
ncbi:MAG: tetratricopeptide repeat protein [Blastocatellia bacterium]|nr:tetratricopeptide repeat protein [Blastocatellia bacterium]MCS7157453.1 tetratricopeptide repeat protein [Blastocatellia bacterium]MDW8168357.1 tetratricopeptide repeat protein [Acidobacteriota bacterium]MDW8255553.1 tetratricopeptide repeat protein [Acidobacteriota bacterium]